MLRHALGLAAAAALSLFPKDAAVAEDPAEFYTGKLVTLLVGSGAGTGYDSYARLLARFLPQHISGRPSVVVQNMPGVSGLKAASYMHNSAPADGTTIALTQSNLPTAPLLTPKAARFDVNRFSWIGSVTKDTYVSYLWHTAPAKTYGDAKKMDVVLGGIAIGSPSVNLAIISNNFFGTRFKIVSGYSSTREMNLAIESGEIQGTFVNTYSALKSAKPDWINDKKIRVILQHGFRPLRDFPDVPLFIEQTATQHQRQALEFVLAPQEYAKPVYGPPSMPADRLTVLRRAFDATIRDSAFLNAAAQAGVDVVDPMTGEELSAVVARVSSTPHSVVEELDRMIADYSSSR